MILKRSTDYAVSSWSEKKQEYSSSTWKAIINDTFFPQGDCCYKILTVQYNTNIWFHLLDLHFVYLLFHFVFFIMSLKLLKNILQVKKIFFNFFCLFRAVPTAYGGSQARGRIRATPASLHHSHSNTRSELCL